MLLAIDAGNSRIKVALFEGDRLQSHFTIPNEPAMTSADVAGWLAPTDVSRGVLPNEVHAAVIGSVVPRVTPALVEYVTTRLSAGLHVVKSTDALGIEIDYDRPASLGVDRIADAVAAAHFAGTPCIAVDMGTATTFNVVVDGPRFAGGVIAPGAGVLSETLAARTAQLEAVLFSKPHSAVARSTRQALQSGLYYGYASMVDGLVDRLREEMGTPHCPVLATGGASAIVGVECRTVTRVEPHLTLHGLRLIYERRANG